MNTKFLASVGIALALAASACGSDSKDNGNNPTSPNGSTPVTTVMGSTVGTVTSTTLVTTTS